MPIKLILQILSLISIICIEIWSTTYNLPLELLAVSYGLATISIFIAFIRGGMSSYLFWIILIIAYPLLLPFANSLLGFNNFSDVAIKFQEPLSLVLPLSIGAFSCFFLSLSILSQKIIFLSFILDKININIDLMNKSKILLIFICLTILFSAWLTEPYISFIGITPYYLMIEEREQIPFAVSIWTTLCVLGLAIVIINSRKYNNSKQIFINVIFWSSVVISSLWIFAHGRRVEPIGLLLFFYCLHQEKIAKIKKVALVIGMVTFLSIIGLIRNIISYDSLHSYLSKLQFLSDPSGANYMLSGYVAGINLIHEGSIPFLYGETYLGHILRIPPKFLGLERPPIPYDYINSFTHLIGGEYLLLEPYLNFGCIGVIGYLMLFVYITNICLLKINKFLYSLNSLIAFVMSATFFICIFRTSWYGASSTIKSLITAWLLVKIYNICYPLFKR